MSNARIFTIERVGERIQCSRERIKDSNADHSKRAGKPASGADQVSCSKSKTQPSLQ